LTGISPNIVYKPDTNYNGRDEFSYGFFDGYAITHVEVSITILPVKDKIVGSDDNCSLSGDEKTSTVNVLRNDKDPDRRPLHIIDSVVYGAGGYAINNGDGSLTYYDTTSSAAPGMHPKNVHRPLKYTDALSYRVSDGQDTVIEILDVNVDR